MDATEPADGDSTNRPVAGMSSKSGQRHSISHDEREGSAKTGSKDETIAEIVEPEFENVPSSINGWVRHSTDRRHLLEYWRKGSNHATGKYEQLIIRELRNGSIRLSVTVYDQFCHEISTDHLTTQSPARTQNLWNMAKDKMESISGKQFIKPPTFPESVGKWEATTRSFEDPVGVTHWERGFGKTELIVTQTGVDAGYTHLTRYHEIQYIEADTGPVVLAANVPRTQAFEIALNTLESLDTPVKKMHTQQDELQVVNGIGPAKSRYFIQLGISSIEQLIEHIESQDDPINYYHSKAVGKLLTQKILTDLVTNHGLESRPQSASMSS